MIIGNCCTWRQLLWRCCYCNGAGDDAFRVKRPLSDSGTFKQEDNTYYKVIWSPIYSILAVRLFTLNWYKTVTNALFSPWCARTCILLYVTSRLVLKQAVWSKMRPDLTSVVVSNRLTTPETISLRLHDGLSTSKALS